MIHELKIHDISSDGRGVARTPEGRVVMVENTLPGDFVEVDLDILSSGSILNGTLTRMIEPSEYRITHPCDFACAGCSASPLGSFKYEVQLGWKQSHLEETLKRISKRHIPAISPIIPSPEVWKYRERVELHLGFSNASTSESPELSLGYLHKQNIIHVNSCLLAVNLVNDSIKKLAANLEHLQGISATDLNSKKPLRVMVRDNGKEDSIVVLFIERGLGTKCLPHLTSWLANSVSNFEVRQVNSYGTRYFSSTLLNSHGDPTVQHKLEGLPPITLSATAFTQTNHAVAKILQEEVIGRLPLNAPVIDIYGGFGAFAFLQDWRSHSSSYVVETSSEAVNSGKKYAHDHHLKTQFLKMNLGHQILPEKILNSSNSIVLDPPRSGGGKRIMRQINMSGCKNIIYVSCHPAALARDIQFLTNYEIQSIQPIDMFPNTTELETIMHLNQKE